MLGKKQEAGSEKQEWVSGINGRLSFSSTQESSSFRTRSVHAWPLSVARPFREVAGGCLLCLQTRSNHKYSPLSSAARALPGSLTVPSGCSPVSRIAA